MPKVHSPDGLTAKQRKFFFEEYPKDWNETAAYVRAGYATCGAGTRVNASRLLTKLLRRPELAAALQHIRKSASFQSEINHERWLKELEAMAFYDVRKLFDAFGNPIEIPALDDATAPAIAGFEFYEDFTSVKEKGEDTKKLAVGYTKKVRLADKRACLMDYGRVRGFYVDRMKVNGTMNHQHQNGQSYSWDQIPLDKRKELRDKISVMIQSYIPKLTHAG